MANVGEIVDLKAWKNTMPMATPSLHVTGLVWAPTPCHDVIATHTGDTKSNPPTYLLRVDLHQQPKICIQMLSMVRFHYIENNYAGNHDKISVSGPNGHGATAAIDTVS